MNLLNETRDILLSNNKTYNSMGKRGNKYGFFWC